MKIMVGCDCHFLFPTLAVTLRFTCIVIDAVTVDLDLVKRNEAAVGDCHFLFLTLAATLRFTCIVVDAVDLDLVKRNENNGGL